MLVRVKGESVQNSFTPIVVYLGAFSVPKVSQASQQKRSSVESAELSC